MTHHSFSAKLEKKQEDNNSLLMVGLDSDLSQLPAVYKEEELPQFAFNKMVIDATCDLVSAYKIQMAFYEEQGLEGYQALVKTLEYIPDDIPVVADGKRNDIGNTSAAYARAFFSKLGVDGLTVNPYLGFETIAPFLHDLSGELELKNLFQDKAIFVLAKTSNPGSGDLQDLVIDSSQGEVPVYQHLVKRFIKGYAELKEKLADEHGARIGEMGFVAGATYPEELGTIRKLVGEDCLLLIPGVGAQGGNVEKTIRYGTNREGRGVLINSSRGVIFPDPHNLGERDTALIKERVREAAQRTRAELNRWR